MRNKLIFAIAFAALMLFIPQNGNAQGLKGLLSKTKEATKGSSSNGQGKSQSTTASRPNSSAKPTATLYVSADTGSNRNDGSKATPLKDLQKAVDVTPDGALILVAEGNYLGNLDRGFVKISKYVSIMGGYSADFSQRDPVQYQTTIRPGPEQAGTNANNGLLDIYVRGNRNGVILIDGLILDKGQQNRYCAVDHDKFKAPEGLETSLLNPPGMVINAWSYFSS